MMFDLVLCALILTTALATVAGTAVFRSIVFFVVYGLLVGLAWVRLGAVDVALAEAAIGAGLTGVLLLSASGRLPTLRQRQAFRPLAALLAASLSAMLVWAWFATPEAAGLGGAVAGSLAETGVGNPVTAVLLNYRAWDTLLESIVLLAALVGVWMLGRDAEWTNPLGLLQHAREGGTMATLGRFLPPVGLLVGVYLVWAGADHPGGAFQGGTVLAAMGILAAMAGRFDPPRVQDPLWRVALVIGPAVFLLAGLAMLVAGLGFLTYPVALAKPVILVIEVFLTLSIAVTLAFIVLGPPGARPPGSRPAAAERAE
jgi:multisubunit Na+/H+ antiporter MnhB subunit